MHNSHRSIVGRDRRGICSLLFVSRLTEVIIPSPGDLEALKKETFVLKEGAEYRVKIHFKVRHLSIEVFHGFSLLPFATTEYLLLCKLCFVSDCLTFRIVPKL